MQNKNSTKKRRKKVSFFLITFLVEFLFSFLFSCFLTFLFSFINSHLSSLLIIDHIPTDDNRMLSKGKQLFGYYHEKVQLFRNTLYNKYDLLEWISAPASKHEHQKSRVPAVNQVSAGRHSCQGMHLVYTRLAMVYRYVAFNWGHSSQGIRYAEVILDWLSRFRLGCLIH